MNARFARLLTRLYPHPWRGRYGKEFQTFLETRPVSIRELADVVWGAIAEQAAEGWPKLALLLFYLVGTAGAELLSVSGGGLREVLSSSPILVRTFYWTWLALEAISLALVIWAITAVRWVWWLPAIVVGIFVAALTVLTPRLPSELASSIVGFAAGLVVLLLFMMAGALLVGLHRAYRLWEPKRLGLSVVSIGFVCATVLSLLSARVIYGDRDDLIFTLVLWAWFAADWSANLIKEDEAPADTTPAA